MTRRAGLGLHDEGPGKGGGGEQKHASAADERGSIDWRSPADRDSSRWRMADGGWIFDP